MTCPIVLEVVAGAATTAAAPAGSSTMTWILAPMQAWLGVGLRAPAAALPALITRRRDACRKRGLNIATRYTRRGIENTCYICRANLTQQAVHQDSSYDTKRVLEFARQAAPQQMPAQSVVRHTIPVESTGPDLL